jgi:hypothetical protein
MDFLNPILYSSFVVAHVISIIIAIGAVTITDYFHIVGLRKRSLERRLLVVYPFLGRMVIWCLVVATITGAVLLANNLSLLEDPLFRLKMALFLVIVLNGIFLHKHIFPHVEKCVLSKTGICPTHVLWASSIAGAISFVTWYGVLILALTKKFAYSVGSFLVFYFLALVIVFLIAFSYERKARAWRKKRK